MIVFICGVKVGSSLEKMRKNESIGLFTKNKNVTNKKSDTEFFVKDNYEIVTNKKILKEEVGDRVHIKTFNYDEIVDAEIESENE